MTSGPQAQSSRAALAVALVVVAAVSVGLRWRAADTDVLFGTDEADYARAMAYGPAAAYLGTHERSGLSFLRSVVDDYRATGWARPFKHDWESGDAAGLRHYHPPVGLYPVATMIASGISDERTLRKVPAMESALACLASTLLAWCLLPSLGPTRRAAAAITAGLLVACSPFHAQNGDELGFHAAFSLFSTLALAAIVWFESSRTRLGWRLAWVATGLTALTIPYWLLLLPPLARAGWNARHEIPARHLVLDAAFVLAVTLVVAWPPFLLTAGFVKGPLMYGGLLVKPLILDSKEWLATPAVAHVAILGLLVTAAVGAFTSPRVRALAIPAVPVALFVVEFLLVNLRVLHMKPLYAGDVIAAMSALAVVAFLLFPRGSVPVAAALAAGLLVQAGMTPVRQWPEWREPMARLEAALAGRRVLVTPRAAASMLSYYLPRSKVVLDSSDPMDQRTLRRMLASHEIDTVLQLGPIPELQGVIESAPPKSPASGEVLAGPAHITWWDLRP